MKDLVKKYGKDILRSKEFKKACRQVHHYRTSVAAHSILTAKMGLKICKGLRRLGIDVDERKVVRIALLHDLGMVGRKLLYKNNFECGRLHPGNSAKIAKKVWKDIDKGSLKAIKSHMWPLSIHIPSSREAFVLCLADKMASVRDVMAVVKARVRS